MIYFGFHITCEGVLLYWDNDLKIQLSKKEFLFPSLFLISNLTAVFFYMICGYDPGYVGQDHGSRELTPFINEIIEGSRVEVGRFLSETDEDQGLTTEFLEEPEENETKGRGYPARHYCRKCNLLQPYRTKHCDSCKACVAKYDHHCTWIGSCVGELNHRLYWSLLLSMEIELSFFIYYVKSILKKSYTGLGYNSEGYEIAHGLAEGTYSKQYGAFILLLIIGVLAFVLIVKKCFFI